MQLPPQLPEKEKDSWSPCCAGIQPQRHCQGFLRHTRQAYVGQHFFDGETLCALPMFAEDPEQAGRMQFLPDKVALDLGYIRDISFWADLRINFTTVILSLVRAWS